MATSDTAKHNVRNITTGLVGLIALMIATSAQSFAQSPVNISVGAAYAKGNGKFNITVKDTPNTKLDLYVNGKNSAQATVNKHNWATFSKVKLSGTGKLSFTKVVNGKQQTLSYTRYYTVSNGKVKFSANTSAPASATIRKVIGTATTLGAGTFTVGKDMAVGLYDVIPASGQSGNFIVTGSDGTSTYNEVLGDPSDGNVSKVRAALVSGDQVQISGLSSVTFTPVKAPFVTAHATTNLYAGTFIVGQDIGAGRYVATPASGESGNFMVYDSNGNNKVNEVLGDPSDGDVPSVAVTLNQGDIIQISGVDQVTMTASN